MYNIILTVTTYIVILYRETTFMELHQIGIASKSNSCDQLITVILCMFEKIAPIKVSFGIVFNISRIIHNIC